MAEAEVANEPGMGEDELAALITAEFPFAPDYGAMTIGFEYHGNDNRWKYRRPDTAVVNHPSHASQNR